MESVAIWIECQVFLLLFLRCTNKQDNDFVTSSTIFIILPLRRHSYAAYKISKFILFSFKAPIVVWDSFCVEHLYYYFYDYCVLAGLTSREFKRASNKKPVTCNNIKSNCSAPYNSTRRNGCWKNYFCPQPKNLSIIPFNLNNSGPVYVSNITNFCFMFHGYEVITKILFGVYITALTFLFLYGCMQIYLVHRKLYSYKRKFAKNR